MGVIRWFRLIRRTYLIKFWNIHFSQWGEDLVVERFVRTIAPDKSYYIDVGCFHPKKYSNTYRLYRRGWRGINIDVAPMALDVFNLARPDDENICCAVGSNPGAATLYSFGHHSPINTLDRDRANEYIRSGLACEQVRVDVRTLTEIIEASRFKRKDIALLNIDVEGHEESVLRSLDFRKYRPAVILVEFHLSSLELLHRDATYRLLTAELGYEMINWTGLTVFFMDKTLLQSLSTSTTR